MGIPHDNEHAWSERSNVSPESLSEVPLIDRPAPPGSALARILRIAEVYPDARPIIERWLEARMPLEATLTLIILDLSERLNQSEKSLYFTVRGEQPIDP